MKSFVHRFLKLNERVPLLVIAAWAILYAPRPFVLGLYHDDWWIFIETAQGSAPFSLERLAAVVGQVFPQRPVAGVLAFLATSISGSSAFGYQACAAAVVLLAALSLRGLLARLAAEQDDARFLAADLGVVFWFSTPWSIAANSWLTCALITGLPAQFFFTEAARRLLLPARWTARRTLALCSWLAASYLCYEAFYFLIFPVAAFAVLSRWRASTDKRQILRLGVALAGCQLLAVGFNRFMSQVTQLGSKKTFNPAWRQLYWQNLRNLPETFAATADPFSKLWAMLVCVLAVVALARLAMAFRDKRRLAGAARVWGIVGLGVSWILLGTVTYALAGYGYTGQGVMARTLLVATAGAAVLFFAAAEALFSPAPSRWAAGALLAVAFSIICLNAYAQNARLSTWAFVWEREQEVLSHAPVREIAALPPKARILFVGPSYYRGLEIFAADWDITGAVFSLPPLSANRKAYRNLKRIHSATTMYDWTWDGETLVQTLPGHFVFKFPAVSLYVWDYEQRRLYPVEKGFHRVASN